MKILLAILMTFALALAVTGYTHANVPHVSNANPEFFKYKLDVLQKVKQRQVLIQKMQSCVNTAQSYEELRSCKELDVTAPLLLSQNK
ncbi:MAG: hypothetical protein PHT07_10405 [Paludibacter sp.]|nr:hypothetical protein [Paludibacter sp.]